MIKKDWADSLKDSLSSKKGKIAQGEMRKISVAAHKTGLGFQPMSNQSVTL